MDKVANVSVLAAHESAASAQNKRKEKARIAARARRSQEASIITEMANELHITQERIRRIDKATVVRLAIDYMKAFETLCKDNKPAKEPAPAPAPEPTPTPLSTSKPLLTQTSPITKNSEPKLNTESMFAPKTDQNNSYFLVIGKGRSSFVLKPDTDILDEDLTHLAPEAGDSSIPLELEPLDGGMSDKDLFTFMKVVESK